MSIENIDIQAAIEKMQAQIQEDTQISPATKSMIELLILIITLLANRLGLSSRNSSKPLSSDPNRKKDKKNKKDWKRA